MPELTQETAKAVVEKAVEFKAWTWDDPNAVTDELVSSTAKMLVDATVQAASNDSVAPAVLEILKVSGIAESEPFNMSKVTLEAYEGRFGKVETNGHGPTPEAAPDEHGGSAFASQPTTAATEAGTAGLPGGEEAKTPDQEQAEDGKLDISDIFKGYDDYKAADIKKAILDSAASGDLTEEEWERIKAYEEANEDRKTIRTLQPEFKQPEPEPQPPPEAQQRQQIIDEHNSSVEAERLVKSAYSGEPTLAEQEGLPIPQASDFSQNPPILPIDITTVPSAELSQVATLFHSLFARALWMQSQEEGRERYAEHLENEAHHDAYSAALANHEAAIPADKRTGTALENARRAAGHDADGAAAVRDYRSRKVRHGVEARSFKALAAGYDKAVWRVNEELNRRARENTTGHAAR